MEEYDRGCSVASKEDGSPVTSADHRAEAIICECLASLAPMPPVCAEESMAAGAKAQVAERFILVDPLDGTREFLAGNGEFTINVALIERGAPVAGAVYAPAIRRLWVGGETAFTCEAPPGAELPGQELRRGIRTRRAPTSLVAFASRSHLDAESDSFLKRLPIGETRFAGSSPKFRRFSLPLRTDANYLGTGKRVAELAEQGQARRPAKGPSGHRMWSGQDVVRARPGAPLVKGNSHGIGIIAIVRVRARVQ